MFDFGAGELVVIGVVALVAIGPKELPGLLRTVGQAVGRMRRMAGDFQNQFNDAMREADMAEAQKLIADIKTDISGDPSSSSSTPIVPSMAPSSMKPFVSSDTLSSESVLVDDQVAPPEPVTDLGVDAQHASAHPADTVEVVGGMEAPIGKTEADIADREAESPTEKPKRKRTKKQDVEPEESAS